MLWWIVALSIATFVVSIAIIPILVARIPVDYFAVERRHRPLWANHHPVIRLILIGLKNILGVVFVAAGIVMLFTPGQGILTILIGIMLVDFPGKYTVERKLVQHPTILRVINWLRSKSGRPPLQLE